MPMRCAKVNYDGASGVTLLLNVFNGVAAFRALGPALFTRKSAGVSPESRSKSANFGSVSRVNRCGSVGTSTTCTPSCFGGVCP